MRRPRVLIASRIYAPEPAAASFRLRGLAKALAAAGPEVTVLTATTPEKATVADPGITEERYRVYRDEQGNVRGYTSYLSFDIPLFFRLLRRRRPDVVVCEPPPTTGAIVRLATRLRRIPYVYYAADIWSDAAASMGIPRFVVWAVRAAERFALAGASRVIAISPEVAKRVADISGRPADVVRNGIDTTAYSPDGPVTEPSKVVGEDPYLLYAGTASEWQGADIFIDCFQQTPATPPNSHLVFIGTGSKWDELREMAADNPAIHVLGHVSQEEAAQWLRGASATLVSIIPGIGYDFAYPTKILASLASGTPCIFVGTGPAAEDIEHNKLGFTTEYDQQELSPVMAMALKRKIADPAKLVAWVQANRSLEESSRQAAAVVREAGRVAGSRGRGR